MKLKLLVSALIFASASQAMELEAPFDTSLIDLAHAIEMRESHDSIARKRTFDQAFSHSNPNATDENGIPLLTIALKHNDLKAADLLFEQGVDINATDRQGSTAVISIIKENPDCLRALQWLIDHNANLSLSNRQNETALSCAFELLNFPAFQLLCKCDANLNHIYPQSHGTLLHEIADGCARWKDLGLAQELAHALALKFAYCLLEHGADVNIQEDQDFYENATPLTNACIALNKPTMELLLHYKADTANEGSLMGMLATDEYAGHDPEIESLLQSKKRPPLPDQVRLFIVHAYARNNIALRLCNREIGKR